jgi:hypothetical protein
MALLFCGSAQASTVTVTERLYTSYVSYSGGRAIESAGGEDGEGSGGAATTQSGLSPAEVGIDGSAHHEGVHYDWSYTALWNLQQGYTAAGDTLHAYGSTYLEIQPENATTGITGWNTQQIRFVVVGTAGYDLDGHVAADVNGTDQNSTRQNLVLEAWDPFDTKWVAVFFDYTDDDFTHSGSLGDGLYRLLNYAYPTVADGAPLVQNSSWDWTLTFADAQVLSAVPLPGAAWLLGTALLGLGGLARRRPPYRFMRFSMRSVTTPGSASVDTSPSEPSSFSATLRRMRRMILPERVLGRPGANWIRSGEAMAPISFLTHCLSSPLRSSVGVSPDISVT